ncbi:MAG: N-acetylmuramoyl-L-alanine amidase [Terriglobales bacterium]
MKNFDRSQRAKRLGAVLLLFLPLLPLQAQGKSEAWARTQYSAAERMRETLKDLPSAQQNRRDYQHVIAAYRRVYYGAPASSKADPSVVAVAELLADMGRRFNDDKILRSAIGQYRFLRREYPGSRDRFDALFTIGRIYQDDLKDPAQAKPAFEEFLRRYPHHHLADEARKAIAEPAQQAGLRSKANDNLDERSGDSKKRAGKTNSTETSKSPETGNPAPDTDAEVPAGSQKPAYVTQVRHWSKPDYTRVAIDLERDVKFESQRIDDPERIFFDLLDTNLPSTLLGKTFEVDDGLLKKIRVAQFQPGKARIVLEVEDRSDYTTFLLTDPPRLIIDVHSKDVHSKAIHAKTVSAEDDPAPDVTDKQIKKPASSTSEAAANAPKKTVVEADDDDDTAEAKLDPPDNKPRTRAASTLAVSTNARGSSRSKRKPAVIFPDVREASPTANGDRSLIRALGLKIGKIVIDPGHGGHDTGTIGPHGLEEKDLVLDVGRRLGKLLQTRLGADVVYTRKDDTFIPLETRTSIANQEQADLFVSIHANSSRDPDARGVETYYLNFTSSAEALDVAARENAASNKSVYELQDLVKKIALKEKIEESREFAANVQRALHSGLAAKSPGIRDRGVKKAPFIVLIGANMPSILAEISFVSNPGDERKLRTSDYRQRIAESLYRGISKYVSGLSGVKVASKIDKD